MDKNYKIITEVTADLSSKLIDELGITVIPMEFKVDDKTYTHYPNASELFFEDFYMKIKNCQNCSTSQINVYQYIEIFEKELKNGFDILYICFSTGLSGTYQSANIAINELKEKYPEKKIIIIDSLCASAGEGLLVYDAVKKQKDGYSINELYKYLEENKLKMCHLFTTDDLVYLKRGGRISSAATFLGNALDIKPIMHLNDEGKIIPILKAKGRKKSLKILVDKTIENFNGDLCNTIMVNHGNCEEDCDFVIKQLKEKLPTVNIIKGRIGSVIGCHTGPGILTVFFYGEKR